MFKQGNFKLFAKIIRYSINVRYYPDSQVTIYYTETESTFLIRETKIKRKSTTELCII